MERRGNSSYFLIILTKDCIVHISYVIWELIAEHWMVSMKEYQIFKYRTFGKTAKHALSFCQMKLLAPQRHQNVVLGTKMIFNKNFNSMCLWNTFKNLCNTLQYILFEILYARHFHSYLTNWSLWIGKIVLPLYPLILFHFTISIKW